MRGETPATPCFWVRSNDRVSFNKKSEPRNKGEARAGLVTPSSVPPDDTSTPAQPPFSLLKLMDRHIVHMGGQEDGGSPGKGPIARDAHLARQILLLHPVWHLPIRLASPREQQLRRVEASPL